MFNISLYDTFDFELEFKNLYETLKTEMFENFDFSLSPDLIDSFNAHFKELLSKLHYRVSTFRYDLNNGKASASFTEITDLSFSLDIEIIDDLGIFPSPDDFLESSLDEWVVSDEELWLNDRISFFYDFVFPYNEEENIQISLRCILSLDGDVNSFSKK